MDISKILNQLEELIYDLFVWFLLLPKTITKLLVNPLWAPDYIDDQLKISETKNRFNQFLSPILLWLLLAGITMFFYVTISFEAVKILGDFVTSVFEKLNTFFNIVLEKAQDTETVNKVMAAKKEISLPDLSKLKDIQSGTIYFLCSGYLLTILATTITVQLFQKLQVSRDAIRKNVYLQFYCYAPVHFMANVANIIIAAYQKEKAVAMVEKYKGFEPTDDWFQKLATEFDADLANVISTDAPNNILYVLYGITVAWFFWTQVSVIKKQLNRSVLESFGILILSLGLAFASLVLLFVLLSPFLSSKLPFFE